MSQAKNKVKWCLNKAKKEIEEGIKHRGLIETEPDLDEAKNHIKKAEHNFKAVVLLEESGFSDWSVNAIFYTIYHCFLGITEIRPLWTIVQSLLALRARVGFLGCQK